MWRKNSIKGHAEHVVFLTRNARKMEIISVPPRKNRPLKTTLERPVMPGCSYPSQVKPFDGSDHGTWTLQRPTLARAAQCPVSFQTRLTPTIRFGRATFFPIQRTNDISVEWDETTYAAQQVGEVPELGVSRLLEADTQSGQQREPCQTRSRYHDGEGSDGNAAWLPRLHRGALWPSRPRWRSPTIWTRCVPS